MIFKNYFKRHKTKTFRGTFHITYAKSLNWKLCDITEENGEIEYVYRMKDPMWIICHFSWVWCTEFNLISLRVQQIPFSGRNW